MWQHSNYNSRCRAPLLILLAVAALSTANIHLAHAVTHPTADSKSASSAAAPAAFQSIAEMPGCRSSSSSSSRALEPQLQECSWSIQMKRGSARWYAFEIPADAAENMSVQIMARAVSGRITLALWGPGSDPYRSVPTQTGTNYMQWPGLRESDQDAAAAGGGHPSIASEQQYLFLARKDKPLLMGQYVVVVRADMGQPLVQIEVSTPSSMTQLVAEEQEALKDLISSCCPGLTRPDSSSDSTATPSAAGPITVTSAWCNTVGQAITYDLRQWYADICHVAPNVCDREGYLRRLMIPPYALRCPAFPRSLGRFRRLQQVDISYSTAPGTLADVAEVVGGLAQLEQLHLRGIGLKGPLSCEVVQQSRSLQSLSLSDNNQLSGTLPACWFESQSLQELQLAGLSGLKGPLPVVEGTSSDTSGSGTASDTRGTGRRLLSLANSVNSVHGSPQKRLLDEGLTPHHIRMLQAGPSGRYPTARAHTRALKAGSAVTSPCGFGQLMYINLAGVIGDAEQGLTGPLPSTLGLCKDLLYLDLSGHALSGALPPLPEQLQYVNLSSNALSDVLPDFAGSPELQYLDLSYNRFRGSISDLTVLQNLDWLDLSDNELSGALPPMPLTVRWVDLSNNQLTGDVDMNQQGVVKPGSEAELMLVLLNLSHNKLSGTLPVSLAVAPHLSFLDLSFNQLLGDLNTFSSALKPTNQMLQVNLSFNRLVGGVPEQMQLLAALRPVMVTMSDGITPVHRIMDLSHNQLSGVFPNWLITVLPQLQEVCGCTVGVNLDASQFKCPDDPPQLNARAQDFLRRFDQLQCVAGDGYAAQQVPIWQLAGPSYQHYSRQEHKELAAQQQQEQQQQQLQDAKHDAGTLAGVIVGVVVAAALVAAAVLMAVKRRQQQHSDKAVNVLLHHFDPYHPAPDAPLGAAPSFEGMQTLPPNIRHTENPVLVSGSPAAFGSPGFNPGYNLVFGIRNHSVMSSGGSSSGGLVDDGMCEIALVVKKGSLGLSQTDGCQGLDAKLKDRDGVV